MNVIYNLAVNAIDGSLRLYARFLGKNNTGKFSRFLKGRRGLNALVAGEMSQCERRSTVIWIHAASLGEYGVARPLIERFRRESGDDCTIVFTFFSPSGYEALAGNHPGIDHLFYLPIDTRHNARRFLNAVRPDRAVFIISELWPNFLQSLKDRGIPTYLVSALIRDNSPFFRWYGRTFRKALTAFNHVYVLNEESRFNLKMLGYEGAELNGDPLFDNAALVASTEWSDPAIEEFSRGHRVFMSGSVSDDRDAELTAAVINASDDDVRHVVVPHDLNAKSISRITSRIDKPWILYSQIRDGKVAADTRVIIMDCVGKLAYLYRYATAAYVGGGFTPLLHSVIEATVYGVPVAFGPCIERKVTPLQLIELGIGRMVRTPEELQQWTAETLGDVEKLADVRRKALDYVNKNTGNTGRIVKTILAGK